MVARGFVHVTNLIAYLQASATTTERDHFSTVHKPRAQAAASSSCIRRHARRLRPPATAARGEACVRFVRLTAQRTDLVEQQAEGTSSRRIVLAASRLVLALTAKIRS